MPTITIANVANRACALLYSFIKEQEDGKWLLPVNVCPDVPLTFCAANIPFEFVDINPTTLCIDELDCISRLRLNPSKYRGIVFVRTYGFIYDNKAFIAECHRISPSIKIIDDRCLCIPSFNPDMFDADMVLFSTGHCKQIDLGGGGIAFYNKLSTYNIDENLVFDGTDETILYKKSYETNSPMEQIPKGWLKMGGFKDYQTYKDEVERKIQNRVILRNSINQVYNAYLPDHVKMKSDFQQWRYNILVPFHLKDTILSNLFDYGLFASNHYHSANKLFDRECYLNSDNLFASVINLFNDNYYSVEKAERTCEIINKIIS